MAIPERPRILFVEDERSISEPFSKALGQLERLDPDLILLDLHLPDGDGRDVCRTIRARSGVPIIILTARGTETDRIVGLELGADDYVVKPFSGAEVIARIRAVLSRSRSTTSTSTSPPAARRSAKRSSRSRARSSTCSPSSCATPAASSPART
jgi:two-component system response regulator RegX3